MEEHIWCRHDMYTLPVMLALCAGNEASIFSHKRPIGHGIDGDVFVDMNEYTNVPLIGDFPHKRLAMPSAVNFLTQIIWWCSCDFIKMRCQVILNSPLLMGWWEYVVYIYHIYIISATLSTDYLSWTWLTHYCRVDVARYGEKENKL